MSAAPKTGPLSAYERLALARLLSCWPAPITIIRWIDEAVPFHEIQLGGIELEQRHWARVWHRGRRPFRTFELTRHVFDAMPALVSAQGRVAFIKAEAASWMSTPEVLQ